MGKPTHDDAVLMVQLAQWSSAMHLGDAMRAIMSEDFDVATAEVSDEPVQALLTFGETVGTLVKHDLFSRELATDWMWFAGIWLRVGPAAARFREALGEPRLYENFEALAKD